jgi:hypothetical protein
VIGVIPKANQRAVVEEFFELFKTPWEWHRPGRKYDVVIATADEIPEVSTKLLIVFGPAPRHIDSLIGVDVRELRRPAVLRNRGSVLPIYGQLLTFSSGSNEVCCVTATSETMGVRASLHGSTVIRLGYDLFEEVRFLISTGQPFENAGSPTLDIHIRMLREWILSAGISFLEVPPVPAGHAFAICLTHDIDFVGIRRHKFDHTMWGFLYRSTAGALSRFLRGRLSLRQLLKCWRAAALLPLVYLGWAKDFWEPFEWYLQAEKDLPATYFLIPFKRRAGENISAPHASRRATAYDVGDIPQWITTLTREGCELGVHGIDAWHSVEKGREELSRIAAATGEKKIGIRMHWLLRDENTFRALEQAGYAYDSTAGYNETIGYRSGTTQAFRPEGAQSLLELPLHIQDGALFYQQRLDLCDAEAWKGCEVLIEHARECGGVLTILWHDRSHGPERFWGEFYSRLLARLRSLDGWFASAVQVVDWFQKRRELRFERLEAANGAGQICARYVGGSIQPALNIRLHQPNGRTASLSTRSSAQSFVDIPWNGEVSELNQLLRKVSECSESSEAEGPVESRDLSDRKGQLTGFLR